MIRFIAAFVKVVLLTLLTVSFEAQALTSDEALLPEKFKVYYNEQAGIVNHPFDGAIEKELPTINAYKGKPGCYVACYSHNANNSIYPVAKDIFVMGQIRVAGSYDNRICKPKGFENADISADNQFKALCEAHLPQVCSAKSCWAGGDTGGWFGIQ